jgi:hypothetical protein
MKHCEEVVMSHSVQDYRSLLARAISALETDTAETREDLYQRARKALVTELRKLEPPTSDADVWREQITLDFAIQDFEWPIATITCAKSA